jgi:hypothetical protein
MAPHFADRQGLEIGTKEENPRGRGTASRGISNQMNRRTLLIQNSLIPTTQNSVSR